MRYGGSSSPGERSIDGLPPTQAVLVENEKGWEVSWTSFPEAFHKRALNCLDVGCKNG